MRRLRYLACALELIAKTRLMPTSKTDPHRQTVTWHRFAGKTPDGALFYVQIKEHMLKKTLHFMSCFGGK
jgi:hypothetical protein